MEETRHRAETKYDSVRARNPVLGEIETYARRARAGGTTRASRSRVGG